ncbi:MAG: EF-hand domain-containing protein, partial [Candidatus Thalassarchaeaceae archaeon]|nr:EF-hand domain-containing protein [Candidatus Thalassarchaeaceae archaeon]
MTTDDGDSSDSETQMAECGACRSEIPIDSTSCPDCGVSFSGVADDDMGECGACGTLLPMDSKSCSQCGVQFVLDDLTTALSVWMKDEGMTISELFAQVDSDNDQSLTADEVKNALEGRNLAFLGSNELDRFISQIDLNDDGVISFAELAAALSMPWTPPEEKVVLEPDVSDEDEDESDGEGSDAVADESTEDDSEAEEENELGYTERVLERVMKAHGITDKEGFLEHAKSS